jgi:SAM-dependent methyltransferase
VILGFLSLIVAGRCLKVEEYEKGYWEKRFMFYSLWGISPFQTEAMDLAHSKVDNSGIRLLDPGCGDGRYLFAYDSAGKLHTRDRVIALDISKEALVLTKGAVPKTIPVQGNALLLPFKENSFDLVLCSMLIEHVPDSILLREIRRVLAPAGVLLLITVIRRPYAPFLTRSPEGRLVLARNHLREYKSNQEIIDLVVNHGFITHRVKSYLFRVSLLHRLLMLGLKLKLFDLPLEKRMVVVDSKLKKIIKLFSLQIPIIGYYTFEGIFIAKEK